MTWPRAEKRLTWRGRSIMDKILLKDAKFLTRVGVTRLERRKKQPVVLNVTACKNLRNVGSDLRKTLDYARLHSEIKKAIEGSEFTLLEEIAEKVANAVKELS